jgi:hypothetical protein
MAVQKELLRHADIQTTMNTYTQAVSAAKREPFRPRSIRDKLQQELGTNSFSAPQQKVWVDSGAGRRPKGATPCAPALHTFTKIPRRYIQ